VIAYIPGPGTTRRHDANLTYVFPSPFPQRLFPVSPNHPFDAPNLPTAFDFPPSISFLAVQWIVGVWASCRHAVSALSFQLVFPSEAACPSPEALDHRVFAELISPSDMD